MIVLYIYSLFCSSLQTRDIQILRVMQVLSCHRDGIESQLMQSENNVTFVSKWTQGVFLILLHSSGDLGELSKHGSLHEYLLFLHKHGQQPISTFHWGKQRVVSVCSAELFKETMKLTYRPSERTPETHPSVTDCIGLAKPWPLLLCFAFVHKWLCSNTSILFY